MKSEHTSQYPSSPRQTAEPPEHLPLAGQAPSPLAHQQLLEIFAGGKDWNPLAEIKRIFASLAPTTSLAFIHKMHDDMTAIFAGKYPGFRHGPTKYHDLRHTRNVTLATIRLFHGLACQGMHLSPEILQLGLASAYFHDTGMLLTNQDTASTGAAYLRNHEERSIVFLSNYLKDKGFFPEHIAACASIIHCTNLMTPPDSLIFSSPEVTIAGHVVGTADIIAQMADRYYLECLPLLYIELRSAGVDRYQSSLELMRQTTRFYHQVIEQRLKVAFNNTAIAMQTHFREWWQIDRNLYMEFITKNINYLEKVIGDCEEEPACIERYLRRKQPKLTFNLDSDQAASAKVANK